MGDKHPSLNLICLIPAITLFLLLVAYLAFFGGALGETVWWVMGTSMLVGIGVLLCIFVLWIVGSFKLREPKVITGIVFALLNILFSAGPVIVLYYLVNSRGLKITY